MKNLFVVLLLLFSKMAIAQKDSCYFEVNKYARYVNKFQHILKTELVSSVKYKRLEYAKKAYKRMKQGNDYYVVMIELKGYCKNQTTIYKRETINKNEIKLL